MNIVLIHSENIYQDLKELFNPECILTFEYSDNIYDIDYELTNFLKIKILPKNPTSIFIQTSLSANSLEFIGIRLACHIRLSSIKDISNIPIILIGEESFEDLFKHYENPELFATKGLYLSTPGSCKIKKYLEKIKNGSLAGCPSIEELAKRVNISPPANYQSHHSITNEWSILRWAKALDINNDVSPLQKIKENIEVKLFYKHLLAKYPDIAEPEKIPTIFQNKGKVLLIDDEWNKGWKTIFEKIFSNNASEGIEFITFKELFQSKKQEEIIDLIVASVEKEDPDVIILDLRLADSDFFDSNQPFDLTGYKVLRKIKEINPGYQIIIFSASNKVRNLLKLQTEGVDGFILKESPELSISKDYAKDSIGALINNINCCLNKAYLKRIHTLSKSIKENIQKNSINEKYSDSTTPVQMYQKLICNHIDIIFNILSSNNENKFNLTIIMMVMILECINSIILREDGKIGNKEITFGDGEKIEYYDYRSKKFRPPKGQEDISSTTNKIRNVIRKFIGKENYYDLVYNLIVRRNKIIHPQKTSSNKSHLREEIQSSDIVDWLQLIERVIAKIA